MNTNTTTLNHFFSVKDLTSDKLSEIVKSEKFQSIKEKMAKEFKGIPVPENFFEEMLKHLNDLLNIDVRSILVGVWAKSDEFLLYIDPEQYPPDETILVPLAEHTLTSEHHPSLKSFVNKIPIGEITLHINLELTLKGVIVKIQNGKVIGAAIGSCTGKGSITYGDMHLIEKESQPWELPGSIELSEGIPIHEKLADFNSILSKIINLTEAN